MDDIFVARIMSADVETVSPDTLVEDAAETMLSMDIGSLVVVDDDGHVAGILTTTDFVRIVAMSDPKAETTIARYMSTDVETASAQESIQTVADRMLDLGVHHLPVVDDDAGLIGILSTSDLASYLSSVDGRGNDVDGTVA
jgi:CBS domain-containing protein